jgi:glutathione S-transferase
MSQIPTLTYYDFPGRGFSIRAAMRYAGKPFVDERINFGDDLPNLRGKQGFSTKIPLGTIPTLQMDNRVFVQSVALACWAAKQSDLWPKESIDDQLLVQEAMETANELQSKLPTHTDKDVMKKLREEFIVTQMPKYCNFFIERLHQSGGPYILGQRFSIADLYCFVVLNLIEAGFADFIPQDVFEKNWPEIHKYYLTLKQAPILKAELDAKKN